MLEKIHILISIIAAFAVAFFCLITKTPFIKSVIGLISTIIVFYIIGLIIKNYFAKSILEEEKSTNIEKSTVENLEINDEEVENVQDTEDDIITEGIDEI